MGHPSPLCPVHDTDETLIGCPCNDYDEEPPPMTIAEFLAAPYRRGITDEEIVEGLQEDRAASERDRGE